MLEVSLCGQFLLSCSFCSSNLMLEVLIFSCICIFLQESKELTSSTRWRFFAQLLFLISLFIILSPFDLIVFPSNILWDSKAVSMFENDERFKAVERSRDREDLFESYIVELERKVGIIQLFMHVHALVLFSGKFPFCRQVCM